MPAEVVGRDEELEALRRLVERPQQDGPAALALEGEAGIGKSTLLRAAAADARARGVRVLVAAPAESESGLPYAALGDLFDDALDDVLPHLSPPQRHALEVVLLLDEAGARPIDGRALGVAVRNALRLIAEEELLIAVDDVQWVDASSASALAFALRRLPASPVAVLTARRLGVAGTGSQLDEALPNVERLRVGPLSVGALHRILREQLGRPLPRPTLLRLHEASGGNPFYALELARALEPSADDPTRPLRIPPPLEELVSARLAGFTGATREALALVSAGAHLDERRLSAAGIADGALAEARRSRVVEVVGGELRFTHPLFGSVLYHGLSPDERARTHRALARVTDDPLARARHLALASDSPDAELAATIEQAADAAAAQGAPIAAAELAEHARRLTPPDQAADADRLAAKAARMHDAAGDVPRARRLAEELVERAAPGPSRAEALGLLADVEIEDLARAIELFEQALREPDVPAALRGYLHGRLSTSVRFRDGLPAAERHAAEAVAIAEELGDDEARAGALASLAIIRFNAGKPDALHLAEQAQELAPGRGSQVDAVAGFALGHVLVWLVELDRARGLLERLGAEWSERDERIAAYALWYLALVELRAGNLARADELAAQSIELAALYSREGAESPTTFFPAALAAAHRGDLGRARALAERILLLAGRHQTRLQGPPAVLGTVALWAGDPEEAVAQFSRAEAIVAPADGREPNMTWWVAEQVEALLALGRRAEATARLDAWEGDARRLDRRWALAHVVRCRGLDAAAAGDVEGACAQLEEAVARHESVGDPFGRGRALLTLGTTLRRARRRRAGREALEEARSTFDRIGAQGWSDRAAEELGRVGGRTRSDGLTPAERRVAELVAKGRTNAEVASELFLAERTVASHLTHVYAKLGVRSRTELARKLT